MSPQRIPLRSFALLVLAPSVLVACGGDGGAGPDLDAIARVSVTPGPVELEIGETTTYRARAFDGRNADVTTESVFTWSATPTGIVKLTPTGTGGALVEVEGDGPGTATLRATAEEAFFEVEVTVLPDPPAFARSFMPGGYLGEPYEVTLAPATGGVGEITYDITAGALPPGLEMDGLTISGTPTEAGMHYFEISAESGGRENPVVFAITVSNNPPEGFNLFAMNAAEQIPSTGVRVQIHEALARWEEIITGDATDFAISPTLYSGVACTEGRLLNGQVVDDVFLFIDIDEIDQGGDDGSNTLGFGGPCHGRDEPLITTITGRLVLDIFDLERMAGESVFAVVTHEIGHVLGVGTWWETNGWLTGRGTAEPLFTGLGAVAEYNVLLDGGSEESVPVEGSYGPGTNDGHWEEATFSRELMTGFLEFGFMPLSLVTVQSMADIGWEVDPGAADAYELPACSPNCGDLAPGREDGVRLVDVPLRPLGVLSRDGREVERSLRRPPGGR